MSAPLRVVIVGNGIAGTMVAAKLRALDRENCSFATQRIGKPVIPEEIRARLW